MAYLTPTSAADDGVLSDQGGNVWRLTKAGATPSALSASLIGEYYTQREAANAGNDGHFLITGGGTDYIDFTNASGVVETVPYWEVVAQNVANDFREYREGSGSGTFVESKILHSTLSNPMTGQGLYCRKFNRTVGGLPDYFWRYQKAGWQNIAHAVSVRAIIRRDDFTLSGGVRDPRPVVVARMNPSSRKDHYSFSGIFDSTYGNVLTLGNAPFSDLSANGLYSKAYGVTVKTTTGLLDLVNDRWFGVRMDALTWGSDVALHLYYLSISDADKILDATPPWQYLGYVLHQAAGTTVKFPEPGIEFNSTLRIKPPTLQGDIGLGYGSGYDGNDVDISWIDSFQAYRMEP